MVQVTSAKTPEEYIAQLVEPRRSQIQQLHELIRQTVPNLEPTMRFGMLGYGTYHYKYASGREGDWAIIALASQKNYISLYVCAESDGKYLAEQYNEQLPKANIGKSCIRFKKAEDVDLGVIQRLLRDAAASYQ